MLALPVLAAHAADIPQLNVAPMCRGIADQGADPSEASELQAGDPNVSFKQCMDGENADKATLTKEWDQFSATNKQHCTNEAKMGGLPSYTELLTCLEMARDVDQDRAQQKKAEQPQHKSSYRRTRS
jgi:hypothetical protein